ncbi:Protein of unknown function DUF1675 [Cynara cardunculus var. scolymus]|uniref:Ninja-family protein n=1 Tax=Cynara cardunculus var. scolymus TaxID=59895 RepID=A0A103XVL8_CYNCS|nr:Protein of unknown function DUF1675 [Cynara cardunculus var. scolymus]
MGDRTSNEMENLSLQMKKRFSRDLLQRFRVNTTSTGDPIGSDPGEDTSDEIELNLGLSLGGRFGVDKSNSKLVRSSSIAAILPVVKDDDVLGVSQGKTGPGGSYSGLIRTSSLPVETEEERRKRKELQSLRRLAAKRRRSEKQRNLTKVERDEYVAAMGRVGSSVGPSLGSGNWDFGDVEGLIGKGGTMNNGSGGGATSDGSGGGLTQPSLPGSVESQASSMSEFESRHFQEGSKQDDSRSKVVNPAVQTSRPKTENPSNNKGKEMRSNMVDMPCVFTQGDSPSGRRIEGILYKYGKGEEVKIMCVCHGSFLSPAEFVKHAGGTDVLHPLKHIVVNPNSSYL